MENPQNVSSVNPKRGRPSKQPVPNEQSAGVQLALNKLQRQGRDVERIIADIRRLEGLYRGLKKQLDELEIAKAEAVREVPNTKSRRSIVNLFKRN